MEAFLALLASPGGIGAIVTLFGLVITKFVEFKLVKRKEKQDAEKQKQEREQNQQDYGSQFRTELRGEIKTLREELRKAEEDSDKWRVSYFELLEQFSSTKIELETALGKIKQQADEAGRKLGE